MSDTPQTRFKTIRSNMKSFSLTMEYKEGRVSSDKNHFGVTLHRKMLFIMMT